MIIAFETPVSSAVKDHSKRVVWALFVVLMLVLGCASPPSEEDKAKLAELQRAFGNRYEFSLYEEFYLNARLKNVTVSSERDAEEIYKIFHFKDFEKGEKRHTSYVYLNIYDSNGHFLFQLFYDPKSKLFARSKTEHY